MSFPLWKNKAQVVIMQKYSNQCYHKSAQHGTPALRLHVQTHIVMFSELS